MQDFPPAVNTSWFPLHVARWVDVLLRSGQSQVAMALAQRLDKDFAHVRGVPDLVRDVELYHIGLPGRTRYFFRLMMKKARASFGPVKRKLHIAS
jgi:hypothetical protein